jgi:hypothetical protein
MRGHPSSISGHDTNLLRLRVLCCSLSLSRHGNLFHTVIVRHELVLVDSTMAPIEESRLHDKSNGRTSPDPLSRRHVSITTSTWEVGNKRISTYNKVRVRGGRNQDLNQST